MELLWDDGIIKFGFTRGILRQRNREKQNCNEK